MKIRAMGNVSRLTGRLLIFVWAVFLAGATVVAQPAKTMVQDTLYSADGNVTHGRLTIRWNGFSTSAGEAVPAGEMTVATDQNGKLSFALIPNVGAIPAGSYYRVVVQLDDGTQSQEQWLVPTTSPTTLAAMRAEVVPQAVAIQYANLSDSAQLARTNQANTFTQPQTVTSSLTVNDLITKSTPVVDVRGFGAQCNATQVNGVWSGTDDTTAIQAALNAAAGNGVVEFPANKFCYVATGTGMFNLPADDGTVQAGATCGGNPCATLAAETQNVMPYAISVPAGVEVRGNNATIVGNFIPLTTLPTLNSLFIFNLPSNGAFQSSLHDLNFQNVFSPFVSAGMYIFEVRNVNVLGCGFGAITQRQDRAKWKNVVIENCAAGIINGGWWNTRNNMITEAGGYADKSKYEDISFIQNQGMYYNAWAQAYDTFFDTYFWKSAHNTDGRLTDPINAGYDVRTVSERGVYGIGIAHMSRNIRPSVGNVVDLMMHYGSPRYAFFGQEEQALDLHSIDVESVGFGDGPQGNCPFGITTSCTSTVLGQTFSNGFANPYVSGKLDGLVNCQNCNGSSIENLTNDNPGNTAAAIDIGGGSYWATSNVEGGNVDSTYGSSYQSSPDQVIGSPANGSAMLSFSRGGNQNLYGMKYYDNAAGGDASTRTCIETAGADTMCFPKTGPIAVNNNITFYNTTSGGMTSGNGFTNPSCNGPQGTASTLGVCRFYLGRGGYDLGFGVNYYDDVANGDANTHMSLTNGGTPLSSTASQALSVFMNGAMSIGLNGVEPASGYGLEIGPATKFDVSPTVPTPAATDNSTKVATTAYVQSQGYLTTATLSSSTLTTSGGQTITSANTVSGLPSGCQQYPCTIYSGHLISAGGSGNRALASLGISPPANGMYEVSVSQIMDTPGTGTGTIQTQVWCTASGGTVNGLEVVSNSPFSGPTLAAGSESNANGVGFCESSQPFEWALSSGNGSAAIDVYVAIVKLW